MKTRFRAEDVDEIGDMEYETSVSKLTKSFTIRGPNNDILPENLTATSQGDDIVVSFPVKYNDIQIGPNTTGVLWEHIWVYNPNAVPMPTYEDYGWHPSSSRLYLDNTGFITDIKGVDTMAPDYQSASNGAIVFRIRQQNKVIFKNCQGDDVSYLLTLHQFVGTKVDNNSWRITEVPVGN